MTAQIQYCAARHQNSRTATASARGGERREEGEEPEELGDTLGQYLYLLKDTDHKRRIHLVKKPSEEEWSISTVSGHTSG